MIVCEFCGLDVHPYRATYVYEVEVCFDCVDLAEMAYEGD